MKTDELCFFLASAIGTSGDEADSCEKAKQCLSKYMSVKTDRLSNLTGTLNEDGKVHILLDAHIDRIGLVVRGIDDNGFIQIDKIGGVDPRVLVGSEVLIFAKKTLKGVVCSTPPHLLKSSDKKSSIDISSLSVDVGMTKEEVEEIVEISDRAVVCSNQLRLLGNRISSAALDDRCGVAAIILALEMVHDKLKNVKLSVALTAQEEVGGSGAQTAAYQLNPDYAIAVDVGFGGDIHTPKSETIELSKGTSIGISPVLDRELMKELVSLAKKNNIKYQHDIMPSRTGTNADKICISKGGIKTALLSIPLRNMHTAVEVIDTEDVESTAKLIAAFILAKEEEYNA